jgi:alkylhydroperoxidase family enzyme
MPFFQTVPEESTAPELRGPVERAKKRHRLDRLPISYHVMAAYPPLLEAFVEAFLALIPVPNRFGTSQFIASMLIAHAKGCVPCFNGSREFLMKIGMDEAALEGMCRHPEDLPLSARDRRFVEFTLRVARDPTGLRPRDFRAMEQAGFSKEEILEMIGVAGFWSMATTVTSALDAGLREE